MIQSNGLVVANPMGKIDRLYIKVHISTHWSTISDLDLRMLEHPRPSTCATGLVWSCEGTCTRRAILRGRVWSCGTPIQVKATLREQLRGFWDCIFESAPSRNVAPVSCGLFVSRRNACSHPHWQPVVLEGSYVHCYGRELDARRELRVSVTRVSTMEYM
jgi:hypothetical protein